MTPNPPDGFARTLLAAAAEVEAAEAQIRQAILDAARAGDCDTVIALVERWGTCPAVEVLVPSKEHLA